MKPFHRILVATDFSAESEPAIRYGADLARRYGAVLDLVFVFEATLHLEPDGRHLLSPGHLAEIVNHYRYRLRGAERVARDAGATRVECAFLEGDARSEIVRFAADRGDGLIVVGTHGRSGFKRWLLGSVAERVMRTSPCPVLTVRDTG